MVQEMGRSGRDGGLTQNVVLYNKQAASGQITTYASDLKVRAELCVALMCERAPHRSWLIPDS